MNQFDRQEDRLSAAYDAGEIDRQTYDQEMRELQLDRRAAAEEAGREAFDNEMGYR